MRSLSKHQPKYPVFIPTKGRYDSAFTIRGFQNIGLDFRIVIEEQEYDQYSKIVDKDQIVVLPFRDQGVTKARNFLWDLAVDEGHDRYWTFDDNIGTKFKTHGVVSMFKFNRNGKLPVLSTKPLLVIEKWADRYQNVGITGMNYEMFIQRKRGYHPPLIVNTRVYSNMLIDTRVKDSEGNPFRFDLFYNEDTDLCLRMLKSGLCVVEWNLYLVKKITTMRIAGGNTPNYQKNLTSKKDETDLMSDGRYRMAKQLRDAHPDCVKITRKWDRWQHQVDYSKFRNNKLIKDPNAPIEDIASFEALNLKEVANAT